MKLKVRQTILIGFAFLSISAFWQMYNNIVPLMLTNTFHMSETVSGIIMAMDNVFALFLLPLFGTLSDRCKNPMGRRKPFILYGTIAAVIVMLLLPVFDNVYAMNGSNALRILFIVTLGLTLIAMGTYRSPAIALMPDTTVKPLRSKANAVINLMGAVGGILYLAIAALLYSEARTAGLKHVNYLPVFAIIAGVMLLALIILLAFVDEPKLVAQTENEQAELDRMEDRAEDHAEANAPQPDTGGMVESKTTPKTSLFFILISIALWFIAYNAIETWFTVYANRTWGMSLGNASLCLMVAMGGAILSYIPIGIIASRVGRKKTILTGLLMMVASFTILFALGFLLESFSPVFLFFFLVIGMGWASVNVNSLPMVVEMADGGNVGRLTGLYYTFSMAAQIVTPIVAGWLMEHVSYYCFFPYAALFMLAAFGTMQFVRHGDSKVITKKGLEAFDVDD